MIKRLLLLLCLIGMAGSAAWADIASGTFKNGGTWKITDQGELYIDATTVPDYKSSTSTGTNAPWISYRQCIQNVRFSSKVQTIGRNAFAHLSYLRKVTFDNHTSANVSLGVQAFLDCCSLRSFDFTYISVIGASAFDHCDLRFVQLPAITRIDDYAFAYNAKMMISSTAFSPSIIISSSAKPTLSTYALSHRCISNTYEVEIYDGSQYVGTEERVSWQNAYYPLYVDANGDIKQSSQRIDLNKYKYVVSVPVSMYDNALKSTESAMSAAGVHINFAQGGLLPVTSNTDIPAYWLFTTDRLVVYTGGMPMPDYNSASDVPWNALRDKIQFAELQVTAVGKNALNGCPLRRIEMSTDTKEIHDFAFANCNPNNNGSYIRPLDLKNVEAVGASAFSNSSFFVEADLPKVTSVGASAFTGCRIEKLTLGAYLANIGTRAFANNGLKNSAHIYVFCKAPVTASDAFEGVSQGNIRLHVPAELANGYSTSPWSSFYLDRIVDFPVIGYVPAKWELTADGTLTIGATYWDGIIPDYENISDQPWFPYRELIRKIKFIGAVKTIGKNAFAFEEPGKSVINSIEAKDVKVIGENAFLNNSKLTSFTSDGIQTIGDRAFANCSSLETVKFGKDVISLGNNVFSGCGLVDVMSVNAATPPAVTAQTFQGLGVVSNNAPAHVKAKARSRVSGQKSVTLEVPDAHISKYLAAQYWNLFSFEYIGEHGGIVESDQAYDGLYVLYEDGTMIVSASAPTDPNNINTGFTISSNARSKVKRVEIQGDLTKLGHQFRDCPNLEEVVLSGGIASLNGTFCNCPKLKTINLDNVSALKTHSSYPAFKGCIALTTVNLPNAVEIGDNCFQGCTALADVTLGGSCEIGMAAFSGCTNLQSIDLGAADLNGAAEAFKNCSKLQSVAYGGTRMPVEIFMGCSALTTLNLGAQLQDIKSEAFVGTAVNRIYVQCPTPPEAVSDAFEGLNLSSIRLYVPAVYGKTYRKADVWKEMSLYEDEDYDELDFPIHFAIGSNGWGVVDETGNLTINAMGALDTNIRDYVAPYAPYIENEICIGNEVTSLPAGSPYKLPFGWVTSDGPRAIVIGYGVMEMGDYALYSNVWDRDLTIDCYAMTPPTMQGEHVFNWNRVGAGANGESPATLNVLNDPEIVAAYKAHPYWSKFNICGTLSSSILKVRAVTFDFAEVTLRPGEQLQLEPRFTPESVENKKLRYEDVSKGHHVYIDDDNNIIFAQSEGVAYIQAYSSYTVSGEELMALWGPTQEIYLKVTVTEPEPGEEIFFDYREGEGTDAPTITCHVLKDEKIDVDNWLQTCEIAGRYDEDDIPTQAIPEWRTGTVNIPEEAMGYEVVRVGAYAFYERQIRVLYIPWTVTQIGYNACAYCDYLTDVYIPSFQPLRLTDAYGEEDENLWNNDAFYRIGEGDDGEGFATLHVPAGSKAAWDIYPWNEWFRYIVEDAPIPDGIKEIKSEELRIKNEEAWYDLSGRKIVNGKLHRGIYINNGRKVVIK